MADDKPFECTQPGCGMRFANEDHLSVHQAKHEMSLCFSSGSSRGACLLTFVADQTPTPTKFLRNCEEMGLFHELSKNPFEEAFKKASEDTKNLDLHESSSVYPAASIDASDSLTDILNTPTPLDVLKREAVRLSCSTSRICTLSSPLTHVNSMSSVTVSTSSHVQHCNNFPLPGPSHDIGSTITATCNSSCCDGVACSVSMATSCSASVCTASAAAADSESSDKTLYLQVMITSPTGEVIPVHIPATAVQHTPANTCQSVAMTTASTGVTIATKQRLKAAIHQNLQAGLLHRNMQVMSQAVEWITANEAATASHSQEPSATTTTTTTATTTTSNTVNQCSRQLHQNTVVRDDIQQQDTVIRASGADIQRQDADTSTQIKRRLSSASDDDLDDRRRRFLERNRAAAARCRYKKKAWMSNLEHRADDMETTNTLLQAEVVKLRHELSHLKRMFLAHQDCPITQRQRALISLSESSTKTDNSESMLPTNNTTSTVPTGCVVPTGSVVPSLSYVPLVKTEVNGSLSVVSELFVTTALNSLNTLTQ